MPPEALVRLNRNNSSFGKVTEDRLTQTVAVGLPLIKGLEFDPASAYSFEAVVEPINLETFEGPLREPSTVRIAPELPCKLQALGKPNGTACGKAEGKARRPANLGRLMSHLVFEDDLKTQEILLQYRRIGKYEKQNPPSGILPFLRELFGCRDEDQSSAIVMVKSPTKDRMPPLVKDYTMC